MRYFALGVLLTLCASGCAPRQNVFDSGRWIDLTHSFDEKAVYWPTNIPFTHKTVAEGMTKKGYYYSSYKFCAEEHGGTHMDAPKHFALGELAIDEVPLARLMGPAAVIDVTAAAAANRDYQVQVSDLTAWETRYGRLPERAMVLLRTGFGHFWPDPLRYTGTTRRGARAVAELHFPGLSAAAAEWLTTQRKINAVGIDTPSIDYGQSQEFETHRALYKAGLVAFENVAALEQLPENGSYVLALPMKIAGGSGAPLRIVAWLPPQR